MSVDGAVREPPFKLHELRCFDAVVRLGSFQAAGDAIGRTHPTVFSSISRLEARLGFALLDRGGYRVVLTEQGRLFHERVATGLVEMDRLRGFAEQLRTGEEPILRIVLGDLCPRELVLPPLAAFFSRRRQTRLHLDFEAVAGPTERLADGTADFVFHRAGCNSWAEHIPISTVELVPVAAPGFLALEADEELTPERLHPFVQAVVRDTSSRSTTEDHLLVDGAHRCTVPDHASKRELIINKLAWGHLPDFLVKDDLEAGALVSLQGAHLPGRKELVVAARRRGDPHGPVATALWAHLHSTFAGPRKESNDSSESTERWSAACCGAETDEAGRL